jgi:hypothetical protein
MIFFIGILISCKCTSKNGSSASQTDKIETTVPLGKSTGVVSQRYNPEGCATVIIMNEGTDSAATLIPKDSIPSQFNQDKLEITFNYRVLKMPNPNGCKVGMPALISDIEIKK